MPESVRRPLFNRPPDPHVSRDAFPSTREAVLRSYAVRQRWMFTSESATEYRPPAPIVSDFGEAETAMPNS